MKIHALLALYAAPALVCYDNSNDAYIPEMWANESLMILDESMVMANLVHRDFQNEVQSMGDVVNTRRPSKFLSSRKGMFDSVIAQDANSVNVQVPLNQHHYNTFVIRDEEGSKSFKDLVSIYLQPAMQAVGRGIDRSVIGQVHRFLGTNATRVGQLGSGSSSTVRAAIIDCREKLNLANVPQDEMRHLVVAAQTESDMLNTDLFVKSNEAGTSDALRRAAIGKLFGFNIYAANSVPQVARVQCDVASGTITNAAAAGAGGGSQACTITGYEAIVGEWATVAGNDQPVHITARTASTNTTAVTLSEANKFATAGSAAITVFRACDAVGTTPAGWTKEVNVDGYNSLPPVAGRLLAHGVGADRRVYTIIEAYPHPSLSNTYSLLLDRPLDRAITDNDKVFPGPSGEFNLAFHKNAIALVNRPLARPMGGAGVLSTVASNGSLSMRVCMQYDSVLQGTRVTCDTLTGVALLDPAMGVQFLA